MGADGKPHPVIGVYPQGEKDIYRVTFTDKTTVECCDEHLWTVRHSSQGTKDRWVVKQLSAIGANHLRSGPCPSLPAGQLKWAIPMTKPVEYPARQTPDRPLSAGRPTG